MKDFAVGDIVYDSNLGRIGRVVQIDIYTIEVYFFESNLKATYVDTNLENLKHVTIRSEETKKKWYDFSEKPIKEGEYLCYCCYIECGGEIEHFYQVIYWDGNEWMSDGIGILKWQEIDKVD